MKKRLFQYTVLFHKFKKGEYIDSSIIIEPKSVLANSEKEVAFKATREIDEKYASDPDNVEILVKEMFPSFHYSSGNATVTRNFSSGNTGTYTLTSAITN